MFPAIADDVRTVSSGSSPLVQVITHPSLVISQRHMPIVRIMLLCGTILHWDCGLLPPWEFLPVQA